MIGFMSLFGPNRPFYSVYVPALAARSCVIGEIIILGFFVFFFSIIISASIYDDVEFTADQVSSGRGRGGLLKNNKATACMCQTQS